MSCKRYKKILTEAAASGDSLRNDAVREHLKSCHHCGEFFARERVLFAAIASRVNEHANAQPSPSLFASVRAAIALEPAPKSKPGLFWVPVTASIILAIVFSAWTIRHRYSGASQTQALAGGSTAPPVSAKNWNPAPQPVFALRNKHRQRSKAFFRNADFHPLVPAGQSSLMDRLVGKIRAGVIDGKVLITQPNQDLQIPAIVIPPLEVDVADDESRGQPGVSGIPIMESSLDVNRSTK